MDKEAVKLFAGHLGTKVESISSQGWAQMRCPLARWTHDSGRDSNPSAAISIKPNGFSHFTCFTCENHSLLDLVLRVRSFKPTGTKINIKAAMALVNAEGDEDLELSFKEYDAPPQFDEDDGNNDAVFPESWLDTFMQARFVPKAMAYLKSRGLDPYTVHDLDIRWDVKREAVCFPTRDQYGRLCGLRGRHIAPGPDQPPYHIYKNPEKHYNRNVWLGENRVDWDKPVLMVESVFDYAAVFPLYENTVAPLTVGMGKRKIKRMCAASDIVTLFDVGAGGDKARELIDKHLPKSTRLHLLPGGPHRTEPGKPAKDPGEMHPGSLYELLAPHLPLENP